MIAGVTLILDDLINLNSRSLCALVFQKLISD